MFLFRSDPAVFVTAHGSSLCDPRMWPVAQARSAGLLRSPLDSEGLRDPAPRFHSGVSGDSAGCDVCRCCHHSWRRGCGCLSFRSSLAASVLFCVGRAGVSILPAQLLEHASLGGEFKPVYEISVRLRAAAVRVCPCAIPSSQGARGPVGPVQPLGQASSPLFSDGTAEAGRRVHFLQIPHSASEPGCSSTSSEASFSCSSRVS